MVKLAEPELRGQAYQAWPTPPVNVTVPVGLNPVAVAVKVEASPLVIVAVELDSVIVQATDKMYIVSATVGDAVAPLLLSPA